MSQQLLTVRETATVLRCSMSWVRALIKSRQLGSIRMGRKILVPAPALAALTCSGTSFNCKNAAKQ